VYGGIDCKVDLQSGPHCVLICAFSATTTMPAAAAAAAAKIRRIIHADNLIHRSLRYKPHGNSAS